MYFFRYRFNIHDVKGVKNGCRTDALFRSEAIRRLLKLVCLRFIHALAFASSLSKYNNTPLMSEILMQIRYDKRMCSSLTQTVSNMWSIVPGAGTVGCNYLSLPLMPASGTPLHIYEPWNMCISLGKGEWLTEYFDPQASPNSKIGRKIIKFPLIYWSVCLVGCVLKGGIY